MKKIIIAGILSLALLNGCASIGGIFGGKKDKIDRVEYRDKYVIIPEEFFKCKPPEILTDEEIAAITSQKQYNDNFVSVLYKNNEICWLSQRDVQAINRFHEIQNQKSEEKDTNEK